jgi:septal ring-binding cell division protein DamX
VTGYCKKKVVNLQETPFITYTDNNQQNYTYALSPPTLSGAYYSTTFNDNNFSLPPGNFTMRLDGWCGSDTVNNFIKKVVY